MIGYSISLFNTAHSILARSASGGVDPDAQAFITAASITDPTQQSAINQLVVDLKGYSIWTKMSAIYPMVGGTASSHKFNLKDPRDLDAAFRLVFMVDGLIQVQELYLTERMDMLILISIQIHLHY